MPTILTPNAGQEETAQRKSNSGRIFQDAHRKLKTRIYANKPFCVHVLPRDVSQRNAKDDAGQMYNKKNRFFDKPAKSTREVRQEQPRKHGVRLHRRIICNFKAIDCRNSSRQLVSFPVVVFEIPPISLGCFMISIRMSGAEEQNRVYWGWWVNLFPCKNNNNSKQIAWRHK